MFRRVVSSAVCLGFVLCLLGCSGSDKTQVAPPKITDAWPVQPKAGGKSNNTNKSAAD